MRDGERTLLFDTGAANVEWAPGAGALASSLRMAAVEPSTVTDIFISHSHPDHVSGLVTKEGALTFPNASIHMTAVEWDYLKGQKEQAKLSAAITPKVVPFAPSATLFPSVTAVPVDGHTPGHSAYAITSGTERLLYIGDSAHHSVISVEHPDWPIDYDTNKELARASRHALLQRAATENLRLYAVHFPYPGVGHVRAYGDAFVWVPETK